MVKPDRAWLFQLVQFESDVVPDSGKTLFLLPISLHLFESDVVPDSGKTIFDWH